MTRIAVDTARLIEFVDRLGRVQAQLNQLRDDTDTRIQDVQARWDGASAQAQAGAHQQWRAGAAQVQDALAALQVIARTAQANYAAAIQVNRDIWLV
jgi:WXG100 family type VII secretion target